MPYGSDLQPYPRVDPAIEGASGGLDGVFSPGGLVDFFRILRRRRAIIFSVIILITLGALAATFGVTRQYTASASLLMSPQKLQVVDVQSVLSDLTTDSSTTESQLQVLQSRTLLEGVVTQLNLTQDPEFNTTLVPASPYRWLNPLTWLAKILPAPAPRSEEDQKAHELNVVINNLQGGLSISRVGVSYVMNVSFTSQDAKKAAVIANTICDRYLTDQLEAKFDATQKANDWLSQRLDSLRQQVEASDRAVEIYRSSNDLSATGPDGQTINDQQLSELNAQLILARTDLAEKESRLGGAQQVARSGGNTDSITEVLQSSVIGDLRSQEAALTAKQADLSAKYGPRHPAIINIEAQRRDIEVQISSEVRRIIAGLSNDVSASRSRVLSLSNSLNELQQRNAKNNSATVKLNELQRQASANQALYESFLGRFKQTSQDQGIESADARIISEAVPPNSASYPKTGLVLFVAFGFSVIAGIALALVVERLDNSFKTVGELESSLQIPNMATIPLFRAVKDEGGNRVSIDRYVLLKPMSAFAEAFRGLRSSLQLSNVDNPPKVVLFTSAIPSEGKSTCSISFARSAAMAGHSVVIIDCDWRHPTIAKFTHTEKPTVGVIDLLVGRATFEEAMQQDAYSSVICIPAISGTMNPPDVLGSEQMKHLIQELRSKFDFVVLDTPPVLPVIDACVLSHLADKSVLVVRWNNTERSATLSAYRKLLEFGSDVAGTVFTQVDPARQAQYGYGDTHYYYSGRYGKYYQN